MPNPKLIMWLAIILGVLFLLKGILCLIFGKIVIGLIDLALAGTYALFLAPRYYRLSKEEWAHQILKNKKAGKDLNK